MSRPTPPAYKTRNWTAYNKALKRRGSLTIWFDPEMMRAAAPTGKRGRQPDYSDSAIQTCLTMKVLFGMALRQTTWCDCGGRSPVANEVRYVGLMDISREENDLWTYYAGLDVSLKEISICVVDIDGEVIARGYCPADPAGVAGWFRNRSLAPRPDRA